MMEEYERLNVVAPPVDSWRVIVRVDKVFWRTDFDVYDRDCGYPKVLLSVDMIVFDEDGTRMLLRLDGDDMIEQFGNVLKEEKVYVIRFFEVRLGGEGIHSNYHIVLRRNTVVERRMQLLPGHCFKFSSVDSIHFDFYPEYRVRDICGVLIRVEELRITKHKGAFTYFLQFVVQDIEKDRINCELYGDPAREAWKDFHAVKGMNKLMCILQYALVKRVEGIASMTNYTNATRVFWNPTFDETSHLRRKLLENAETV